MSDLTWLSQSPARPDAGLAGTFGRMLPRGSLHEAARGGGVAAVVLPLEGWGLAGGDAWALLDTTEAARARRQRNPRDRDGLALAYALHRLLLASILDVPPDAVGIRRDEKGCPRLPGDAWQTSLSHASGRVAFAVSAAGPVGIDLESDDRVQDVVPIFERIAHRDEADSLGAMEPSSRARALLALWVRKEAFLKAAGIGLEREMETFALPDGRPCALPGGRHAGRPAMTQLVDIGPGWTCAIAHVPSARVTLFAPQGVSLVD